MKQIRMYTFETNSSSTHSLSICMIDEYESWRNGKTYFKEYARKDEKQFYTKEEAINYIMANAYRSVDFTTFDDEEFDDFVRDYDFYTYENYGGEYYEHFSEEFTTPSGDRIKVFGYYGDNY